MLLHIDASFAAGEPPAAERIVRDDSGVDLESARIRDTLAGLHWRDVPFETLEELRSALPFLSPEAFRFYLPAYMTISIADFPRADLIPLEVLRSLTRPQPGDLDRIRELAEANPELQPFGEGEWQGLMETVEESLRSGGPAESTFSERASGFTPQQAAAIRDFLEYMRDVHGDDLPEGLPEQALARHWA